MQGSGTGQQAGGKVTRAAVNRVIGSQEQEVHLEKPCSRFTANTTEHSRVSLYVVAAVKW